MKGQIIKNGKSAIGIFVLNPEIKHSVRISSKKKGTKTTEFDIEKETLQDSEARRKHFLKLGAKVSEQSKTSKKIKKT